MSNRHVTAGPGILQTGGAYSPAVVCAGQCFTSGQLPFDPATGQLVAGTLADELGQALTNVEAVLAASGFVLDDVASATVVLADIADWPELDRAWRAYFADRPLPARMVFQGALALGARVEVQTVASRDADRASG